MCRSCGIPDLIHIKNESHLGMDGTRGDGSRGAPRAGSALPGRESSSGVSRDEKKQGHPVHKDEYFQIRCFTATEQREEPSPRSTPGQADLRNPVVQTAALLTEQVQLLQSRVLPGTFSWVLFTQEEGGDVSHMFLSKKHHTKTSEMII